MVEHEPVVLAERPPLACGPQRRHLAAGDDRELERAVERRRPASVPLADDAALLVDEREAAVQVVADDGEERLEAPAADDGVGQALVHGQRPRLLLELLVRQVGEGRLRDRHERDVVGDGQHRERELVGLLDEGHRDVREAEADPEPEPCEPVLGEAADVARWLVPSSPTPSPVVSRNSPPSRNGVGSASSETWSQLTALASPSAPAATVSSSSVMVAMSRTVSMRALSTRWPKRYGNRGRRSRPSAGAWPHRPTRRPVPRREQHRVDEVPPVLGLEGEPEGGDHGELALRDGLRHVRGERDEPLGELWAEPGCGAAPPIRPNDARRPCRPWRSRGR